MDLKRPRKVDSPSNNSQLITPVMDMSNDQKRRSSSRSIKRKRFDDEIVQYSLGIPPTQVNRTARTRTTSQTSVAASPNARASTPTTIPITSAATPVNMPTPAIKSLEEIPANFGTTIATPHTPVAQKKSITPPNSVNRSVANLSTLPAVATTVPSASSTTDEKSMHEVAKEASPANNSLLLNAPTPQMATARMKTQSPPVKAAPIILAPIPTTTLNSSASAVQDKRRSVKSLSSKKSKRHRTGHQPVTKDLGRWKPIDDLSLIIGIQQTNDLRLVHQGVKFSCKFTIQELQNRWYSLLYDEPISRIAVAAMRNLHPEIVESVHSKALYTVQEEELLGNIKSTDAPTLDTFRQLLDKNAHTFYPARTPKILFNHWNLMKQYMLLPDQQIVTNKTSISLTTLPDGDPNIHFSDQEDKLNDAELAEARDEALELELALADRKCKKEIRHLENELPRWTVLVDSITGIGLHPDFDNQTLAVLRGRLVRYLMRSREITFGRKSEHDDVDVNLSHEGPAHKVSRRQGTIKLRSNGDFFIANEGKRPIFIDGIPLLQGSKTKLNNNCTIEIAGLRVVFMVNVELINAIRQESAKMNGPLN